MAYSVERLGAWYNNKDDFFAAVKNVAGLITRGGTTAIQVGQGANNAANNLSDPFAYRMNVTTGLMLAGGVGLGVWALTRRRRNPPRGSRRRR